MSSLEHPPLPTHEHGVTDFEQQLFKDGAYVFVPALELHKAGSDYAAVANYRGAQPWVDTDKVVAQMPDVAEMLTWKQNNSGAIPARWAAVGENGEERFGSPAWGAIRTDLEAAKEQQIQLSTPLIDAAVTHPVSHVREAAGLNQRLEQWQLADLLANDRAVPIHPHVLSAIKRAQVDMGVPYAAVTAAETMAETLRASRDQQALEAMRNPRPSPEGRTAGFLSKIGLSRRR